MNNILFTVLLIVIVLCFAALSVVFWRMREVNISFWEKLPRNRTAGGILGTIALLAFIPNVKPLFSPMDNLYWLLPALLVLAVLCWLYLDHLLARAFAGAVILLAHRMLMESYSADLKGSAFFAAMCLICGTYAIFIAAKPYWLRDTIRLVCRKKIWRITCSAVSMLWAVSALILLLQQIGRISK